MFNDTKALFTPAVKMRLGRLDLKWTADTVGTSATRLSVYVHASLSCFVLNIALL